MNAAELADDVWKAIDFAGTGASAGMGTDSTDVGGSLLGGTGYARDLVFGVVSCVMLGVLAASHLTRMGVLLLLPIVLVLTWTTKNIMIVVVNSKVVLMQKLWAKLRAKVLGTIVGLVVVPVIRNDEAVAIVIAPTSVAFSDLLIRRSAPTTVSVMLVLRRLTVRRVMDVAGTKMKVTLRSTTITVGSMRSRHLELVRSRVSRSTLILLVTKFGTTNG